jgi:hypothetical protein
MAWEQLLSIQQEAAELSRLERDAPPVACPNDGEPLLTGPSVTPYCPFDGWPWREVR